MPLSARTRDLISSLVVNDPWEGAPRSVDFFGAIIGGEQPSRYSLSPRLWNDFFRRFGVSGWYCALDLPKGEELPRLLSVLLDAPECVDITITNPYKAAAREILELTRPGACFSDRVRHLGCLNHIYPLSEAGAPYSDNTDGRGMLRALKKRRDVAGAEALLVGSGGAAASIAYELAQADTELYIANIVEADAQALKEALEAIRSDRTIIRAGGWELIAGIAPRCELLISAITRSSPLDAAQSRQLPPGCLCADVRYGEAAAFARVLRSAGRQCVDGREMLFGQFCLAAENIAPALDLEPRELPACFEKIEREFLILPTEAPR